MIETDVNTISVDEIMQKIKNEVENRTKTSQATSPKQTRSLTPSSFKTVQKTIPKSIYILSDFTQYEDEAFIAYCYQHILQREADRQGKAFYLTKLREGSISKEDIVLKLRFSKEGRERNINILGSKKRLLRLFLYKIPLLGFFIELFSVLFRLPKLLRKINAKLEQELHAKVNQETFQTTLNEIEKNTKEELKTKVNQEHLHQIQNSLVEQLNTKVNRDTLHQIQQSLVEQLNTKVNHETVHGLQHAIMVQLNNKATQKEFEFYLQTLNYAKESMRISQNKMQDLINEAKKRLPDETLTSQELQSITQEESHKFDAFYVAFEDRFRGSREDIKARLNVYLPYLENLAFPKEEITLLDIGCGRGEWLELLTEHDYPNVKGLDLNRIMVTQSQEMGLCVVESDVLAYLSTLEDESLCVLTGFHIIEHLPFEVLMKLFEESYRVLKKGGLIIYETPNPENILIGACNFYSDPTHLNPLVPFATQFMAEQHQFQEIEIKRLHKYSDYFDVKEQNEFISSLFYNEMDYAVIGHKK